MTAPLLTTALHSAHRALGARLTPFSGWDMPLHYGSQVQEHHAVRRDAGMFDVSHMRVIDVAGAAAGDFLRELLANDVAKLDRDGAALYSCMLREDGGILDDLIVYRVGGGRYRLVVNAGTAQQDLAWMRSRCGQQPLVITVRDDLAILALQGPQARDKCWRALPQLREATLALPRYSAAQCDDLMVARTGYTGEDGFEIMLPAAQAPQVWHALLAAGITPCGLGARDTLRLEAGMNLYGQDMDATVTPQESALAWTVDLSTDREFTGRAALAARPANRQLLGVVLRDAGVMRAHQAVHCAAGDGVLTSGGYAPTLERSIALARVPAAALPGDTAEIEIRGRRLTAVLVKPPFVRMGQPSVTLTGVL
jgi:aminomethyltransferase